MPRPGTTITTSAAAVAAPVGAPLGTWMIAAQTQRGPLIPTAASPVRSLGDYTATYGTRDATVGSAVASYDAVDAFFRSGGQSIYVARVVGPAAVYATKTLQDRAGSPVNTLRVDARGPGAWYNTHIKVSVADGVTSNTYVITILVDDVATEVSPELSTPTEAVSWASTSSALVTITDLASATAAPNNNPAVLSATALATGADDLTSVTDTHWTSALNTAFPADLGPGLVSKVSVTTAAGHAGTMTHAAATNRLAILDGASGSSQATLTSLASTVQAAAGTTSEYGFVVGPWLIVPPASTGTTSRTIASSSVAAGLISRTVSAGTPNIAAAGDAGKASWVLGPQTVFTATERDTLNGASPVNVFRRPYPASASPDVELYGYNTLASIAAGSSNSGWRQATAQLLRLQITHDLRLLGEQFVFDQIDGKGMKLAELKAAVMGVLHAHWEAGALYGSTPADAYRVDTDSVNTPSTIAAGELHYRVNARVSPYAEFVFGDVVKVAASQPITA